VKHAWHLFPIWVEPARRDSLIGNLRERGIDVMVNYRAIHLLTYFRETLGTRPGDFPIAERMGESTISLPFYPRMPPGDVEQVVEALREILAADGPAADGPADGPPVTAAAPRGGRGHTIPGRP
jgi:dTDP-4-amino-4,6-dideoxygalactose transaminase